MRSSEFENFESQVTSLSSAILYSSNSLEFPCPLFRPALHNNLLLREELHRIHALSVHIAEERFLPSAERKESHRRGDTDVDSNIARVRFVSKSARGIAAVCE
mgnify:CR=1 FL=1